MKYIITGERLRELESEPKWWMGRLYLYRLGQYPIQLSLFTAEEIGVNVNRSRVLNQMSK